MTSITQRNPFSLSEAVNSGQDTLSNCGRTPIEPIIRSDANNFCTNIVNFGWANLTSAVDFEDTGSLQVGEDFDDEDEEHVVTLSDCKSQNGR